MSSLASYLAKNYLNADTPELPKKKRKKSKKSKTTTEEESGLIIADDDPPDLRASTEISSTNKRKGRFLTGAGDDEDDDEGYTIANLGGGISMEPKKKKKSGWTTIQPAQTSKPDDADAAAADAILASAAQEAASHANPDADAPTLVETDADSKFAQRMESGARAGLQTASQTEAMMREQRKKKAREAAGAKPSALENTTIYRDASGRIINVSMARAQARREEEEKAEQERRERDAARGDVQRREREEKKRELDEARFMTLARGVDDEEMNREMKEAVRWNDPAAAFLTSRNGEGNGGGRGSSKKMYKGPAPPNRYGIRPGHRWDGVDRSTGFERKWFEARNKRERVGMLEYAWQMDE